ncbi:MAG: hypothetical protein EOP86_16330 [Verrucomicrobiaceae bacterium]|nr:MAG: hypothetical protein EOP86_16330 [Verrucomicrobiaceae bacterium]
MKSLSDLRELLMDIRKRPAGHFREPCYEKLCAFIRGIEYAVTYPLMDGFHEKITAAGAPPNLVWESGLLYVVVEGSHGDMDIVITDPEADFHACRELLDRLVEHLDGRAAGRRRRSGGSQALPGKSPAQIRELLMRLRKRTGMFVRDPYYEKVCCFVRGLDSALDFSLTAGLRERVIAAGGPPNLGWDHGFLHVMFRNDPDPVRTALTGKDADVRVTTTLLDLIMGRMDAGTDN